MGKTGKSLLLLLLLGLSSCSVKSSGGDVTEPGARPSRSKSEDTDKTEIVFWKRRGPKRMWA